MKSQFIFLIMLLPLLTFSQTWDYVDFTPDYGNSLKNACIDDSDNVYAIGGNSSSVKKFNPSGILEWEKDVSTLIWGGSAYIGQGGIEYSNSNVYAVGYRESTARGVIIECGTSLGDVPLVWEELTCTPSTASCIVNDIKVEGNFIYVVGEFGFSGVSSTIEFYGGTTLNSSRRTAFIAKYSILPSKELIWAKKIDTSKSARGVNLDMDDSGNIFISGSFRGNTVFYNEMTPYFFTSSTSGLMDTYLAKFDNDGNFDAEFGLKIRVAAGTGGRSSYDVEVSNTNEAVYWAEHDNVLAYQKDGPGDFLWIKNSIHSKTFSIETNNCGNVYTTGETGTPVKAICGNDYFALSLDHIDGAIIWSSNSTSCVSLGSEVLIDSNNKELIVGIYFTVSGSGILTIDDDFSSSSSNGYFIGRFDDEPVNNCCKNPANITLPTMVTMCDSNFEELCGPLGWYPDGMYSYEWWGPDPDLMESVLLSDSRCFTPTMAGSYILIVTDQNGCVTTHHITIVMYSPFVPELLDISFCPDDMVKPLIGWYPDPFVDYPCTPEYTWTHNGTLIEGADSYHTPYIGEGTYCVFVAFEFFTEMRCFDVVECCEPNTEFSISWISNGDGTYSLSLTNFSSDHYVSDTYFVEKDCNHDGVAGPWFYVGEFTRTVGFDDPVVFEDLDPDCLYRITHRVPSPCKMMVFVHTEYVGGSPGLVDGNRQINNNFGTSSQNISAISPNPTRGITTLSIQNIEGIYQVEVYNLQGQLLKSLETSQPSTEINLNDFENGIYLIKASNGMDSFTKRVVKM